MSALTLPCIQCGENLLDAPIGVLVQLPCGACCESCVDEHSGKCTKCCGYLEGCEPHSDEVASCIRCAEPLAVGDAYSVLPCGACCDWCIESHCDSCPTCRAHCDADPFHNPDGALPGMAPAVAAQAEAAAEHAGAQLTQQMRESGADVSRITGRMESHSPLFRGSDADPQLSLF